MPGTTATAELSNLVDSLSDNLLLNLNLISKHDSEFTELFNKMEKCEHLKEFIEEQKTIMRRHLDKHKYYRGIADREKAVESFVSDYAWLMREMYCDKVCPNSKDCAAYQNYLNKVKEH
jgi:trehalose-6-phosphate synthase